MQITRFRLLPEDCCRNIDLTAFQAMLPDSMNVSLKDDGVYVDVTSAKIEDKAALFLINRELSRLFFLTSIRLRAEMCSTTVVADLDMGWQVGGQIPCGTGPQKWSYRLGLQLHLWMLAAAEDDLVSKIILLFQIVELEHPEKTDYPKYEDASCNPDPKTECKLLRNWVAHAGDVKAAELKHYCKYLKRPEVMFDPSDEGDVGIAKEKVGLLENQAKAVISHTLRQ